MKQEYFNDWINVLLMLFLKSYVKLDKYVILKKV